VEGLPRSLSFSRSDHLVFSLRAFETFFFVLFFAVVSMKGA
jgi:hypothetical protein